MLGFIFSMREDLDELRAAREQLLDSVAIH
jgi:hypothetical protein